MKSDIPYMPEGYCIVYPRITIAWIELREPTILNQLFKMLSYPNGITGLLVKFQDDGSQALIGDISAAGPVGIIGWENNGTRLVTHYSTTIRKLLYFADHKYYPM